jgi:hypothetical protein
MTPPAWESFQHSLPAAPGVDAKLIRGNISDKEKQVNANVLAYFTTGSGVSPFPPFSSEIGGRLKIVELNVWENERTGSAEGEAVVEIEVTESEFALVFDSTVTRRAELPGWIGRYVQCLRNDARRLCGVYARPVRNFHSIANVGERS